MKGASTSGNWTARNLINEVRGRAGKWRLAPLEYKDYGVDLSKLYADHSAEMKAATPDNITIDYILDERFREFFGEGLRWFDLVRTQTWEKMAGTYHICNDTYGNVPEKFTNSKSSKYFVN